MAPPLPDAHRVYTLDELASMQLEGPKWIVPNVVEVAGKVMLYGHGGLGKSTVVMDLAISVASGTPFLGLTAPVVTGPVLLASTESSLRANRDRLIWLARAHDIATDAPLHYMHDAVFLDDAADRTIFWSLVAKIRPVLVILDPLDSFFWGDEDKAYTTKPVRQFLDAVTRQLGSAVFAITHAAAKDVEAGGLKKPRGSTAWYGWADTVIHAREDRRKSGKTRLVLDAIKQRNGVAQELIRVSPRVEPDRGLILFDPDLPAGSEDAPATATARVVEALKAGGNLTLTALRERVGGRTSTLRAMLEELERTGVVSTADVEVPAGYGRIRRATAWRLANGAAAAPAVAAVPLTSYLPALAGIAPL